jgi:hypothetical protein
MRSSREPRTIAGQKAGARIMHNIMNNGSDERAQGAGSVRMRKLEGSEFCERRKIAELRTKSGTMHPK